MNDKKNLTLRYCITQLTYLSAAMGVNGFAVPYLLAIGISSGLVGTIVAVAGVCAFLTQPFVASAVDSSRKVSITKVSMLLLLVCSFCYGLQMLPQMPTWMMCILYLMIIWGWKILAPMVNTLYVAYSQAGYVMNYGKGRCVGAVSCAITSLVLGSVIAKLGTTWMLGILMVSTILTFFMIMGYPAIEPVVSERAEEDESCSVLQFISRYKWYCASLIGILFMGMFLAMTENYLIAVMEKMGGDSSDVGVSLFICALVSAPVFFVYDKIREHISDTGLLKIAAISFLVKAVLYCFANSILMIHALQFLHITSFSLLSPTQVYYARRRVKPCDMAKGQAFSTAMYAMGCSAGSFLGGLFLNFGVNFMLVAGIVMALIGAVVTFATVNRSDS